ncbi:MAG: SPOR domain-containing protein [Rhodoluna sp.]|nr:SPOR domain-containing protein [Rhodoluna sp.]
MTEQEQPEFWFNTKTGLVEEGRQVLALYRIGPFATRLEAENALKILKQRSKTWTEEEQEER